MAIDDNTVYGLTGAQVKELPGKIAAVKGLAKKLTSADYNYPTNSPTSVALWLLEPGVYTSPAGVNVCITSTSTLFVTGGGLYVVGAPTSSSGNSVVYVAESSGASGDYPARALVLNSSGGAVRDKILLGQDDIINTLSGTDSSKVLSARQGKVLKDLVDSLAIRGAGAPTTSTVGQVGTLYEDATNGDLYICTDATNPYVWEEVGGGPTVIQTTGTSTTDVMSQASTSQMIFPSGFEISKDRIAVGDDAVASAAKGIAIGQHTTSSHAGSVAIGHGAMTNVVGEVNIGSNYNTSYGYNDTSYRLLTGLHDPVNAHDAATKGYVDTNMPVITMTDTDPGEGSALAENHYIGVYGGDPIIMDYSLSEINTGAYWIDGSAIYKKTINFGALPNATSKNVAHGISNLGELVKYEGTVRNATNIFLNINSPGITSGYIRTIVDNTNITVVTDTDRSGDTAYITLYYTKSS